MNQRINTSIVLYGDVDPRGATTWKEFFTYCTSKNIIDTLPNHIGLEGELFHSDKVVNLSRVKKKLLQSLDNHAALESMELFVLPEQYHTAIFDYELYIHRGFARPGFERDSYIFVSFNQKFDTVIQLDTLIGDLKNFIQFKSGQIFKMAKNESAFMYAIGAVSAQDRETLEIISYL